MNNFDIRVFVKGVGSWIIASLGECSQNEALIHLNNEIRKFATSKERGGRKFRVYLEINERLFH